MRYGHFGYEEVMDMPISMRRRQHFLLVRYTERDNAVRANKQPPAIELEDHMREVGKSLPQAPELVGQDKPKDFIEYLNQRSLDSARTVPEKKTAKRLVDLVEGNAPKVKDHSGRHPVQQPKRPTIGEYPKEFSIKNLMDPNRGLKLPGQDPSKASLPIFTPNRDTDKAREANLPPTVQAALNKLRREEELAAESGEAKPGLNMEPKKPPKREVPKALQDLVSQKKKYD